MADALYTIIVTPSDSETTGNNVAPQVTAKSTTGFTIAHQNSAGAKKLDVMVIGKVHNA